ncbi:MAG: hypothetical protein FVQ83_02525 [Chloroflexi bacterium]|nr:hypothetical protein [Chloroflexota bacterium]
MMMTSSEERLKILQMIQDEKISPEDGAKLLSALNEGSQQSRHSTGKFDPRYIRVRVTDKFTGKTKVSVNLPLGLVDAGLNIASNFVPSMGIEDISEAIRSGMVGKIVDIEDEEDGERVEIFIE